MSDAPALPTVPRESQRIAALDGVRGLMALVVVVWHIFLILSPSIDTWMHEYAGSAGLWWWYLLDPEFLTRGIVVFFLLSGLVVALPAMRPGFSWREYFPSRLLRLYVPAWAAFVFAIALILLIPRGTASAGSWLATTNATHISLDAVLAEATLFVPEPKIDNPLWSLGWEVIFSLLLPLYVLLALRTRRHWLWMIGASLALTAVGIELEIAALVFLPSFLIGAIAAANLDRVRAAAAVLSRSRFHTVWWSLVFAGSTVAVFGYRVTESMQLVKPFTLVNHVLESSSVLGYAGFVFLTIGCASAGRAFGSALAQWLGGISFSLYVIHAPILVTLAFVLGPNEWWIIPLGLPLSVLAAAVFTRFVERPAHRLAKRVGRRARRPVVLPERSALGIGREAPAEAA